MKKYVLDFGDAKVSNKDMAMSVEWFRDFLKSPNMNVVAITKAKIITLETNDRQPIRKVNRNL
jgi:hypothetical protein